MTYSEFAASVEQSEPVELYVFTQGSRNFRYTSNESKIVLSGITYLPLAITHSAVVNSSEDRQLTFSVNLPTAGTIAEEFLSIPPGQKTEVAVFQYERKDGISPELIQIFSGIVVSSSLEDNGKTTKLSCQPRISLAARSTPRLVFSGMCGHVLYDAQCKVSRSNAAFRLTATVSAVDSTATVLTIPGASAFGDGWFTAGIVEASGGLDARLVLSQVGNAITLLVPFAQSPLGQSVVLLAGCAHDATTCDTKFDNYINYGGFNFVPVQNPFESGIDV